MNRYQSYKPSGVEWIGEIPSNWNVTKIKYIKKDSKDSFIDGDWIESKDLSDEGIRYITSGNIGEGRYKEQGSGYISEDTFKELNCTEIFEGDLVISRLFLPVGRSCILPNLNNNRVITCVDNVVLRPKESFNKSYLNYQFNSNRYSEFTELISRGVTLTRISRGMLGNNSIVVPPLQEQLSIVQFLDEKTELIDRLISTKERKITLLKEQRTSLINEVVSKGLNTNVKMKDSGVEWIGEIPETWKVGKLKHHSELNISSVDKHIFDEEISIRVCNYTDVYYNEFISNNLELRIGSCTPEEFKRFLLEKGDVIITKDSESPSDIGVPSLVIDELENVVCGYHLSIIKSNLNSLIGEYLFRQLQTTRVRRYFEVNSNGITRFGLGKSSVLELPLLLPPVKEQIEIIENLDSKTKEIDDLVQLEKKKIDLLKEYRQSLISEVVTGKIKVTN
jgi:type I restriction enzyme S subunit